MIELKRKDILPIQFVGTQRSGSNLLRVMLNQLQEISAPHPPHILKTFFPLLPLYGDLSEPINFNSLVVDVCEWVNVNPVRWDDFWLEPEQIMELCKKNTLLELFKRIYEQKALHDNARFWCCKSMESVYYYSEIERSKLSPFYIHIYRDGRDVALSFMKAIVGPKHIYFLAKKWREEQELSLLLMNRVDDSRFISVRYEELIHNPSHAIKSICHKLGVPYSREVFEYFHSDESINTANSGRMWRNVTKPIMDNNHDKFKRELSSEQIMIFEQVAGDMLARLGYENIFWPNLPVEEFTNEQILDFGRMDKILMDKVLAEADPDELRRRKPQEELLHRIKTRKVTIV